MASVKLSSKTELTSVASGDFLPINDVSDTTDGANGTSKKITQANLTSGLATTASPTFTGTVTIPTPFTLGAVSVTPTGTELNYVDGVTSSIQTQLDTKISAASPTFTGTVSVPATNFTVGSSLPFSDSSGTLTLQNVDVLDATTESTIEAAIDTLANLTSIQGNTVTLTGAFIRSGAHSLTLTTTGTTVSTLPSGTDTLAGLGTAQTFTATQTQKQENWTNNAIAASGNAATVPITHRLHTVTNNSAATLTITLTTTSAVDGQLVMVRILDFSAAAQTITWVNTENSYVSAPTTTNGSTTLFLTAGFIYNGSTSKWRCIAVA